jgi:hypothetical protein
MFDRFSILSGNLYFSASTENDVWLIETEDRKLKQGTLVTMTIRFNTQRTTKAVFEKYATDASSFDFSRTHVPVTLARYGDEQLVSRSQARRVLARFDRFREVLLDFSGVTTIGHSFADEIFRVFRQERPDIFVHGVNVTPEISAIISRVTASV